jgi:hypothetical protein
VTRITLRTDKPCSFGWSDRHHCIAFDDRDLHIVALPAIDDGIEKMVEALDKLPDDLCLFLDRKAQRFRVLRCADALRLDGRQLFVADRAVSGSRNKAGGEVRYGEQRAGDHGSLSLQVPEGIRIAYGLVFSRSGAVT